jgi:REP element-mobilizing transposase RayT
MSRPLRIEFPGAVYHVTSRGDRREAIYRDDEDRQAQLEVIAHAMQRFGAQLLAYCQMGNHFHLVLHTRAANLSRVMRHVNGVYTLAFNRRHGLTGHLFQGRFKAILVDRDAYLLALCRYVERNPVAAGLVAQAGDWPWSSCRAHTGLAATPEWLDTDGLLGHLLGRPIASADDRRQAAQRYAEFVDHARDEDGRFWQQALRGQVYLGDETFVQRMQAQAEPDRLAARAVPRAQRNQARTWAQHLRACQGDRNAALCAAYRSGGFTMTRLAALADLSVSHVSRLVAMGEREQGKREA